MIPKQPFGRTGHMSSRIIFGGAALGMVTQKPADAVLEEMLQYGINHIDTAASYGESELRIGPWMAEHRKDFFLATKTGERTYDKAKDQIHRSLERLQVDQVDLIQFHCLIDPHEWEVAMGPGGVLDAAIEARQQGLVRFIGVTGHGWTAPAMHMRSLERFDFDSVLLPCNYVMLQNQQYAQDFNALLAMCRKRNVAVQTIKSVARAPWGDRPHSRFPWYEPFEEQSDIDKAVGWVLGHPGIFLNTVSDVHILPRVLSAADRFSGTPPSDEEMQALMQQRHMEPIFV